MLVVDCRRNFLDLDLDMVNFFLEKNLSFIVVLSKVDKLSKLSIDKHLKFLKENCDNVNFLKLSTKTRVGLYGLKETILNYV